MTKKSWGILAMLLITACTIQTKVSAQSYLIGMTDIHFCNNQQTNWELDIPTKAGEKTPICVEISNKWTIPITVNIDFSDSVIMKNNNKNRACNASDRPKKNFANFIIPYQQSIAIPAEQSVQKEFFIQYPVGYSGISHGCLAYYIAGSDTIDNDMFTVRIRSVKYIDILVTDTEPIQAIKLFQAPMLTQVDNEYIVSFGIKNEGNVPEKIHITSTISNIFWYQKDFVFDTTIPAQTWILLTTQSFVLPVYWWPYRFKNKILYTPQFNFNITDGKHPSEIYKGWTKKTQTILFVRTRQSWLTIIIIGLMIYGIFKKRKKETIK